MSRKRPKFRTLAGWGARTRTSAFQNCHRLAVIAEASDECQFLAHCYARQPIEFATGFGALRTRTAARRRFVANVLTRYVFVDTMNESLICYGTAASVVGESGATLGAREERGPAPKCRGGAPGGAAPLRHWGARRRNGAAGRVMVRQGAPLRTRRLPALHIPRLRGSGKKGKGAPGARNSKCPGGVALAV